MRPLLILLMIALMSLVAATGAIADCGYRPVVASSIWTDFASNSVILNGVPAPAGSVVDAFDSEGVHCGTRTLTTPGYLPATMVYGDHGSTPDIDEGCIYGDIVVFRINGVLARVPSGNYEWNGLGPVHVISLEAGTANVGDLDSDGLINLDDIVFFVAFIFQGGPQPSPKVRADVNCDMRFNMTDGVYLVNFLFSGGPAPCAGC